MLESTMSIIQGHPFHLVSPSPWPIFTCFSFSVSVSSDLVGDISIYFSSKSGICNCFSDFSRFSLCSIPEWVYSGRTVNIPVIGPRLPAIYGTQSINPVHNILTSSTSKLAIQGIPDSFTFDPSILYLSKWLLYFIGHLAYFLPVLVCMLYILSNNLGKSFPIFISFTGRPIVGVPRNPIRSLRTLLDVYNRSVYNYIINRAWMQNQPLFRLYRILARLMRFLGLITHYYRLYENVFIRLGPLYEPFAGMFIPISFYTSRTFRIHLSSGILTQGAVDFINRLILNIRSAARMINRIITRQMSLIQTPQWEGITDNTYIESLEGQFNDLFRNLRGLWFLIGTIAAAVRTLINRNLR